MMNKWVAVLLTAVTVAFIYANFAYATSEVLRDRHSREARAQRPINPVARMVALVLLLHAGSEGPRAWRK